MASIRIGFVSRGVLLKKAEFPAHTDVNVIVGRAANCPISLNVPSVSSEHAQLIQNFQNELYIADLNSSNGTYVNGSRLAPHTPVRIRPGDKINLGGEVSLEFNPGSSASGPRPSNGQSISMPKNDELTRLLQQRGKIVLGRSSECDVVLDSPSISRRHATLELSGQSVIITDLGSLNGTYVNGRKVSGSMKIQTNDTFFLGKYQLSLAGGARDLSKEIAIKTNRIVKTFSNGVTGLHETSIEIPSQSLLAVMGPSGCGKSTLLKALNGDSPPTAGEVYISGLELNANYDYLKTRIGYVPQDDIVHRELTVEQSITYAARLRLNNSSEEAIRAKVADVMTALNITHIKSNLVGKISGGQRKRVSIAVEILTDPLILFLDEPTSPLDPQTIEEFLGRLEKLAENGTTVVMVTHKPEDLNYMHSAIFMAEGGHLVYHGGSKEYLPYFGVEDTVKVYSLLVKEKAKPWISKYLSNRRAGTTSPKQAKQSVSSSPNLFKQWWWLTLRYFNIKLNDRVNSAIMVGQAPIIAGLVCLIFDYITQAVPFLMAVSAVWFGTNNAAREIVGELPIYKRERMFNQGIWPYIFSKIFVLGSFAAVQSALFVLIISLRYSNPDPDLPVDWNDPITSFTWMLILSIAASLMGLLLSAVVATTEKVMTLVPLALIPQIMLAGVVAPIKLWGVELLSYFTLARWGTEGFCIIQEDVVAKEPLMPDLGNVASSESNNTEKGIEMTDSIHNAHEDLCKQFHEDYISTWDSNFELRNAAENIDGNWFNLDLIAVSSISLLFLITIYIALRSKDSMKIG